MFFFSFFARLFWPVFLCFFIEITCERKRHTMRFFSFARWTMLPRMAHPGPLYIRTLRSLLLKDPKTHSQILGGSQTPACSTEQLWARRGLEIHSPQASPPLTEYTDSHSTRVDYPQFLLWQCLTGMRKRFWVEWKVSIAYYQDRPVTLVCNIDLTTENYFHHFRPKVTLYTTMSTNNLHCFVVVQWLNWKGMSISEIGGYHTSIHYGELPQ